MISMKSELFNGEENFTFKATIILVERSGLVDNRVRRRKKGGFLFSVVCETKS